MENNYNTQPALVELLLRRDPKGCEHLCKTYSAKIYGYIIRIVNNPKIADQLLEKTFKAICKNIHQFKNSQVTFLTWALQFARSESINYLSSTNLKTGTARNSYTDAVNDTTAVNEIAIFNMIHKGYKVYEVAEILRIPVDEVKINIRKAMKQKTNPN
ncbi:MAG: sigma-70 family RNA polymerase sigma factor [Bacteroidota bacterium]|nr:sigma-70 family RNA polymerase sigma factor [Bacteroidota bacterium]